MAKLHLANHPAPGPMKYAAQWSKSKACTFVLYRLARLITSLYAMQAYN